MEDNSFKTETAIYIYFLPMGEATLTHYLTPPLRNK